MSRPFVVQMFVQQTLTEDLNFKRSANVVLVIRMYASATN